MITPTNQQQQKLSPKLWSGHWILINRDIFILSNYHIAPDPHQQLKYFMHYTDKGMMNSKLELTVM